MQEELKKLRNKVLQQKEWTGSRARKWKNCWNRQKQLQQQMEQAKQNFEENKQQQQEFNQQKNEELQEKQEQLEKLFDDAMSEEMKKLMEDIKNCSRR